MVALSSCRALRVLRAPLFASIAVISACADDVPDNTPKNVSGSAGTAGASAASGSAGSETGGTGGAGGGAATAGTAGTAGVSGTAGTAGVSGASGTAGASGTSGGSAGTAGSTGPSVYIHLRSSTAEVPQDDGFSGETPIAHSSGLRSFKLFRSQNDPAPWSVFDNGTGFVEASYADGADTVVAQIPMSALVADHYVRGRVVHSHVHYKIDATSHVGGNAYPGVFDNIQVLSNQTTLDGQTHDQGWYSYTFTTGTVSTPLTGNNAPIPQYTGSGGFEVKNENGEWAYYFPVNLDVVAGVTTDVHIVMNVNMYKSYRWQDDSSPGYTTGVFDFTTSGSETVKRFGANSFGVTLE